MKKAFIHINGCERRELDATRIQNYLIKNKYIIVNSPSKADVIIFIGCAVLDKPTDISFKKIKEFQKYKAELIVAGCIPAIEPNALADRFSGKTLTTEYLNKKPEKIDQLFPENKVPFKEIKDANILFKNMNINSLFDLITYCLGKSKKIDNFYFKLKSYIFTQIFGENYVLYRFLFKEKYSFQVRVSWGCPSRCSYCSINKAVGPLESKPIDQCVKELKRGISQGYENIILTGDNVGAYGLDIGKTLPELLYKTSFAAGNYKMMILNFHPRWLVKYIKDLEKILIDNKINCIDIPIQSGSTRILKLMNRFSDIEEIKNACKKLKEVAPKLILGTDIIIGFPSETEEEFKKTLDFIRESDFQIGTAIKYSCKIGTKAEKIEGKISTKKIDKRFNYAKKFFKKQGYNIMYLPRMHYFVFFKKS